MKIPVHRCHKDAKLPSYARPHDAGADIYALEDATFGPFETKLLPTGLKVAIPCGYEIQIRPRSGLSLKTPLRIPNSPGTIDAGYRDEVGVIMQNTSSQEVQIKKGDRIAQMVLQRVPQIQWEEKETVEDIGENRRSGFGGSDNDSRE